MQLPANVWAALGVVRRRLQATPDNLLPIAAAIADAIGSSANPPVTIPVSNVLVTLLPGPALNVEVREYVPPSPTPTTGGANGTSTPVSTPTVPNAAPSFSIGAVTAAVSEPSFTAELATSMVEQGLPQVDATSLGVTEPVIEFSTITAPSPPPPREPPSPPLPLSPAQHLLSTSTASGQSASDVETASPSEQSGTLVALAFVSMGAVLIVVVCPIILCAAFYWLKQLRKRTKMDPATLTGVVTVEGPNADNGGAAFDRAFASSSAGAPASAMPRTLSVGALVPAPRIGSHQQLPFASTSYIDDAPPIRTEVDPQSPPPRPGVALTL